MMNHSLYFSRFSDRSIFRAFLHELQSIADALVIISFIIIFISFFLLFSSMELDSLNRR